MKTWQKLSERHHISQFSWFNFQLVTVLLYYLRGKFPPQTVEENWVTFAKFSEFVTANVYPGFTNFFQGVLM